MVILDLWQTVRCLGEGFHDALSVLRRILLRGKVRCLPYIVAGGL